MISPILKQFVEERKVDGTLLERLLELSPSEEEALAFLLEQLRPSANALREILRLADEICVRDRTALSVLLSSQVIREIAGGEDVPVKERQRRVKGFLEKRRFPEKCRLEAEAADLAEGIRKRFGLTPRLPEELEGDAISFSVSARSGEQLGEIAARLQELAGSSQLEKLFCLLLGADTPAETEREPAQLMEPK